MSGSLQWWLKKRVVITTLRQAIYHGIKIGVLDGVAQLIELFRGLAPHEDSLLQIMKIDEISESVWGDY